MSELLDIINENDEIIGQDTREDVHKLGLLHREIHIWFITPDGKMIFQHRAKDKDTYPDLLDATVGGHVDQGMTYEEAAIKEMEEETGVRARIEDLIVLKKIRNRSVDSVTGRINNVFRLQYGYVFRGDINDLKVEKGKAVGFESWPIEKMFNLDDNEKSKFIPIYFLEEFLEMFTDLKRIINK